MFYASSTFILLTSCNLIIHEGVLKKNCRIKLKAKIMKTFFSTSSTLFEGLLESLGFQIFKYFLRGQPPLF